MVPYCKYFLAHVFLCLSTCYVYDYFVSFVNLRRQSGNNQRDFLPIIYPNLIKFWHQILLNTRHPFTHFFFIIHWTSCERANPCCGLPAKVETLHNLFISLTDKGFASKFELAISRILSFNEISDFYTNPIYFYSIHPKSSYLIFSCECHGCRTGKHYRQN